MSSPHVYRNRKSFSAIQFTFAFSIVFILIMVMTIQSAFASTQEELERDHMPEGYQGGLIIEKQAQIHNSCRVSWSVGADSDLVVTVEPEKTLPPLLIYFPFSTKVADSIELNPILHSSHPFSLNLNKFTNKYEGSSTFPQIRNKVLTDTKITLHLSFDLHQKQLTIMQQAYFVYGAAQGMTTGEAFLLSCSQ